MWQENPAGGQSCHCFLLDDGTNILRMITFLVVALLFAAFGALALRFGADTRDGRDWQPYDINAPRTPRW